ncbi:uncharacterized protein SPPG_03136 [Spizellomyces punctatus DAOM BR117]|uniref:Nucleolar GTP-binding protein 2 n=1 Tax=Spizellomyces punctatus (strain DAOM BR117) TaxID=645134 RepID=A0A0L0HJM3_SPIPD|nr:uncharacterized protein SPPG_03136 [Spizellomyces punctatus DAOM BR117]KND01322.1 hypothetical protein SPPG_03136 [Spizellomyces punctatus DAOM BR117]|eukprot:XP_016609361.1 hypothetical protein SPPG_03136 [Spizellomyces punctatus DAOM BR117]
MGKQKKEKARQAAEKSSSGGPSLSNVTHVKGVNFYRDAKKVRQVNMLKGGKATRNADGKIIKAAEFQTRLAPGTQARVQPDRRWFENTRTIGQNALTAFREAMASRANDPYTFIMRQNKLPMSLLTDPTKVSRMQLLETDSFANTFGPKAQRKKPKLKAGSLDDLAVNVSDSLDGYDAAKDENLLANVRTDGAIDAAKDPFLRAGQSRRIWNELYKVLDSSDVVIHVLDARDPMGTRCKNVEKYLKEEAKHKHLIFVLNKCDLVPTWVTAKWVKILSQEYPTLAFHASINNSFGKGSLIQLLRQFSKLHADKKQISVGFFGYPNTGKSSIINTLRQKKVCTVAPIPGETKVWQYITLMKRIYLIDCPGVVHPGPEDSETDIVLRGVVRIENISGPEHHIPAVLERVHPEYIRRTYDVREWEDHIDFLSQVAKNTGKLLKGGEPNVPAAAKMVLNDWLRGKIPYYAMPPDSEEHEAREKADEQAGPIVQQIFSKIPVTTKFLPDDAKRDAGDDATALTDGEEDAVNVETEAKGDEENPIENDTVTDWDEVFESVVGEDGPVIEQDDLESPSESGEPDVEGVADAEAEEESVESDADETSTPEAVQPVDTRTRMRQRLLKAKGLPKFSVKDVGTSSNKRQHEDSDDDSDKTRVKKSPRMTTNKKKVGDHYYESANVKNKNRNKQKPIDPATLAKKLQGKGTRRR